MHIDPGKLMRTGIQIPLPGLIGVIIALLFNAGILYNQFDELRTSSKNITQFIEKSNARLQEVEKVQIKNEEHVARTEDDQRRTFHTLDDHEGRIRKLEQRK